MGSVLESRWSGTTTDEQRVFAFQLTSRRVVVSVLVVQFLLLGSVGLHRLGIDVPLVRPVLAFLYLTFVPGFLTLRLVGIDPERASALLVYTVGASLAWLMWVGALLNFGLRAAGVARPLTELPLVVTLSGSVLVLTAVYYHYRRNDARRISVDIDRSISPSVLGLALLPLIGIYGALALTRFDSNLLLVGLYLVIAVLPVLVLAELIPREVLPFAIWTVALALLLQNTLTGQFLAWGDQVNEASLVVFVLETGYWDPAMAPHHPNKFTMLRIGLLHPVYALFTGLEVAWLFKIVHPLLLSALPVALYLTYRRYTGEKTAFLSVFLYMSLFSFFLVLSRNTRTATALFFIGLLLLVLTDENVDSVRGNLLAIVFGGSVIVSHYGVSYILMLGLALALPVLKCFEWVSSERAKRVTSATFVSLYGVIAFAWYIYASPGSRSFRLLIGFFEHFISSLRGEFLADPGSTSATARYATADFGSITLEILTAYNFVIGGIIIFGLGVAIWRLVTDDDEIGFDVEYLTYALVFMMIFGITFLPVERFNTARTYATSLLVFAPFFVVGVRGLLRIGTLARISENRLPVRQIAAVGIVVYFTLNVGLVSVAVTQEYSPNILVEKERVMESGNPLEQEYFYKQYRTSYDVSSNAWLRSNAEPGADVYSSQWPGNPRGVVGERDERWTGERSVPVEGRSIPRDSRVGPGYVYLGSFSYLGNIVKFPGGHFQFNWEYTSDVESQWDHKNRVYDNGGSAIYYSR